MSQPIALPPLFGLGARALLCALGGSGCSLTYQEALEKRQCSQASDCAEEAEQLGYPLECSQRVCQPAACGETAECGAGLSCVAQRCVLAESALAACQRDRDCAGPAERCGFDGVCYQKWDCLEDELDWSQAETPLTYRTTIRLAEDPTNPSAVGDLSVLVCSAGDPRCENPSVRQEDIRIGDQKVVDVRFETTLPTGFSGFIAVTAADEGSDNPMMPVYRLFNSETPLITTMVDAENVKSFRVESLAGLAAAFAVDVEPGAAFAEVHVHDCGGRSAPNISVDVRGMPDLPFLVLPENNGVPIAGATTTTPAGIITLLNLPPNKSYQLILRDEELGRVVTDTLPAHVHGPALNYVVYYPRFSALRAWLREAERQGLMPQSTSAL